MEITTIAVIMLFLIGMIVAYFTGIKTGTINQNKFWEQQIPNHRKDAVERSRAVLSGIFSEQITPYLPGFKYFPTECKFIGKPIDFIIFKGMDEKKIEEIIFVEVKSGKAKLSGKEKNIKEVIETKKIRFEEYRVPENLTKIKEQ